VRAPAGLTRQLIAEQRRLAGAVVARDPAAASIQWVAGVDAAFPRGGEITRGAAVLMRWPSLETVDQAVVERPTELPYIPGLLSFRELPAIEAALDALRREPDLVFCDGQGIAHPRRFGIACHLGVKRGLRTIGVGKSRLCGHHDLPGEERGGQAALMDGSERLGTVLRTRSKVKPVFVSIGHGISLTRAVALTLEAAPRYRLPEPIRAADKLAGGRSRIQSSMCSS
jgi:deoxyribonuclease V